VQNKPEAPDAPPSSEVTTGETGSGGVPLPVAVPAQSSGSGPRPAPPPIRPRPPLARPATPTAFEPVSPAEAPRPAETPATFVPSAAPPPMPAQASHAPPSSMSGPAPAAAVRADVGQQPATRHRPSPTHVLRSRAYAFVLDEHGLPIEIGSGRFAKAYLGEERWLESKTDFRRAVVIKILQKGVGDEDMMRFQMEKELLERVQGHPNIIRLHASGEGNDGDFIPASIRDHVEPEYMILEKLDMSLEERLKGSRTRSQKEDLLASPMQERIFRVLDYMIPIASAIEYAHLVRNICHRDLKPANILIGLPDPGLRGSQLEVRLADFNVAKLHDDDVSIQMTQLRSVPGTLFFQSPEQETNILELLVNVSQGSPEVEYFEDFYIQIAKNDTFSLFNRGEQYPILYADRTRKRIMLARPYRGPNESNVRARIQKSVGRPADIYSLGATFYYLISGAYANPKTLYDTFHKFIEYERAEESNTIESYLAHEYGVINSLRAPKTEGGVEVAPADRFFSYKHYLDGNGELIDPHVMKIIAKCMIRNKPDSYCQSHEIDTRGITDLVNDLIELYTIFGVHPAARPPQLGRSLGRSGGGKNLAKSLDRVGSRLKWWWITLMNKLRGKRR
jgi:serine/threonine protein kinase